MSHQSLCTLITESHSIGISVESSQANYRPYFQLLANATSEIGDVSLLNRITYAYIAPPIIVCGIIGDIMTVITLTHPSLRRVSIVFTYLMLLAITDLMTLLSIIPMILWLLDWRLCSYPSALFYAHVGFPLEEKRLFVLLFSIVIVFFVCTIPAAPLTIFVSDQRSKDLLFQKTISCYQPSISKDLYLCAHMTAILQIIRGIINVMEFTKFALNFYFYCLINPNIRCICLHIIRCRKLSRTPRLKGGQTVNVMSQYSRSTRSVRNESNSNRSHCPDEQSTAPSKSSVISVAKVPLHPRVVSFRFLKKDVVHFVSQVNFPVIDPKRDLPIITLKFFCQIHKLKFRSAKILAEIIGTNNDAYGKMTIIREGDNMNGDPNERTSML
ncbi:unnamed protein product [Anisakis simplex]|uniref:G_PROTEIN_RECEP_F1_2 domain-containing protein n=1 Tax=Anisakis simplex TaxID=6269 RepID=A0A158PNX9_ANISI|nr:unnamed protein product [Anisakis simplex]